MEYLTLGSPGSFAGASCLRWHGARVVARAMRSSAADKLMDSVAGLTG
jgi:hypothetical protein